MLLERSASRGPVGLDFECINWKRARGRKLGGAFGFGTTIHSGEAWGRGTARCRRGMTHRQWVNQRRIACSGAVGPARVRLKLGSFCKVGGRAEATPQAMGLPHRWIETGSFCKAGRGRRELIGREPNQRHL